MATKEEVDVAAEAVERANENNSGASYPDLLRLFAVVAIEAVDNFRYAEKRRTCKHQNKTGQGRLASDGSSNYYWYCPECGMSGSSETPPSVARTLI